MGTWCLATYDVDRSVSGAASGSWKTTIATESIDGDRLVLSESLFSSLNSFIQKVALDPIGVYNYLNPSPPPPLPAPTTSAKKANSKASVSTSRRDDGDQTPRAKQDEQDESEQDRGARLRIAALGAIRWIVSISPILSEDHRAFYLNPAFWTVLHPAETNPWAEVESFGFAQPNVRKAGWALLQTLLASQKGDYLQSQFYSTTYLQLRPHRAFSADSEHSHFTFGMDRNGFQCPRCHVATPSNIPQTYASSLL